MNDKYLVTGGTGFIGSALTRRLVKSGHQVRVFDNNSRGNLRRIKDILKDIEFVEGDIRSKEDVFKALKGIDVVCHLAYINGTEFFYSKPEAVLEVGLKGIINILDGCIKENIKNFIYASTSEVYQTPPYVPTDEKVPLSISDPFNPRYSYAGGKIASELMTIHYGRKFFDKTIIFRPHNVYGPDMGWEHVLPQFILRMNDICNKNKNNNLIDFPIKGSGEDTRAFVYVDDFTDGLELVLNEGNNLNIYNIGTSDEITIKDLAFTLGTYFHKDIRIVNEKQTSTGGTNRRCPDITKLLNLGYKPKISLHKGIELTANWYIKNHHLKTGAKSE